MASAFQLIPPRQASSSLLQLMQPWSFQQRYLPPPSPPEPKSFTPKLLSFSPTFLQPIVQQPSLSLTPEILSLLQQYQQLPKQQQPAGPLPPPPVSLPSPSHLPLSPGSSHEPSPGPIDITTLVNLSIKDLNKQLRGMDRCDVVRLKQLRRRLKNRTYAKLSRHKRVATITMLEDEIRELENELRALNQETDKVQRNTEETVSKLEVLLQFARQHNISVPG